MSQETIPGTTENIRGKKEFGYNWVNSSRFIFYLSVFCIVASSIGGCYKLYQERYKGKPDVEVPGNTQYTPEYK
ncbi:MAG TPA: hypothetical protein VHB48_10545 [Chitinophagaceae bacterium]|nr:hypothetical protein [Chitinophagaceae bacterium]